MLTFRIFGVSVRIDFLFVGMMTVFLLTDRTGFSVLALLCCLIHELGHLLMFFLVGYTPRALIFELTGIRLVKPEQALSPGKEALVQCAGSFVNFAVFFLLRGTVGKVSGLSVFAVTHLLLGVFHLLPLKTLDGGKLLYLLCSACFSLRTAETVCAAADFAVTLGLLGLAAFLILRGGGSIALAVFAAGLLVSLTAKLLGIRLR